MVQKIYNSVLGRLAVEVPLFAENILNNALNKVGADPSNVTAFQMQQAIDKYIEPDLKKKLGLQKSVQEIGAGVIVLDQKGKIMNSSPAVARLLPTLSSIKFKIVKDVTSDIITTKERSVKLLQIPLMNAENVLDGYVCLVTDITLDEELKEEMMKTYKNLKNSEKEVQKRNKELEKFNRLAVDRELRMVELKKKLNGVRGKS